jgi:hypothetical protein
MVFWSLFFLTYMLMQIEHCFNNIFFPWQPESVNEKLKRSRGMVECEVLIAYLSSHESNCVRNTNKRLGFSFWTLNHSGIVQRLTGFLLRETACSGLEGIEIVDERARHAALNGAVFERPLPPVDSQGLERSVLLRERQGSGMLQTLVVSLTPYSQKILFDLGLRVKGRTGNLFPLCRE